MSGLLFNKMYVQTDILGSALNAASVRNEVINNNIANNDVPGYKTKTVSFEKSLIDAIDKKKKTGVLDLSNAKPTVRFINEFYSYRVDTNNVDIETEMVNLYQNSIKYDVMINSVQNNSKRMSLALTGR